MRIGWTLIPSSLTQGNSFYFEKKNKIRDSLFEISNKSEMNKAFLYRLFYACIAGSLRPDGLERKQQTLDL